MSAPELVVGSVVAGKYAIRSVLFHGGPMATYRAVGAKNREVAVKVYDPAILSLPQVSGALALHRSVAAKLGQDQVLPIVDSGKDQSSGAPFTVTNFESAPSLGRLIDRGPLSTDDTAALVHNLARVIDQLHSNGIATLTLHPGNVFVHPGGGARIADFGSTLVRDALPVPEKALRFMPWLAPEQIKAQAPATQAADIFALALIAFFAVTGRPYWRSSQMKSPDAAALRREILGERMPASVRASDFSVALNPAVDAVFARALAFRATDRHASAREFASGLEAALTGRTVAEIEASRASSTNISSSTVQAGQTPSATSRASSTDEAGPSARRMAAPPPRKMPQRATMVGLGNFESEDEKTIARPRLPQTTMLGMGEAAAQAVAAATAASQKGIAPQDNSARAPAPASPVVPVKAPPQMVAPPGIPGVSAKATAPSHPTAAAKNGPPPMPAIQANVSPPAMPMTPATSAKASPPALPLRPSPAAATAPNAMVASPVIAIAAPVVSSPAVPSPVVSSPVVPSPATPVATGNPAATAMPDTRGIHAAPPEAPPPAATSPRAAPPPLPMAPPPAELNAALANFEASAMCRMPETSTSASLVTSTDVAAIPPAWSAAASRDSGTERVVTGVAVIGTDLADKPKSSRMRWIATAVGLVLVTGGGAWALSGSSHARTVSDAQPANAMSATVDTASPATAFAPAATAEPVSGAQAADEAPPAAQQPINDPPPEPAATAMPPPEPESHEPGAPFEEHGGASEAAGTQARTVANSAGSQSSTRAQPSSKPCGKFLKRCK